MSVVAEEASIKQEMDGTDVAMATLARHNVATPNQAMTPQSVQPSPTMAQIQHALQRAINPDQSVAAYAQHLQSEASMVRAFSNLAVLQLESFFLLSISILQPILFYLCVLY
jgi:predicted dinucleotide-binding enzyme